MIPHAFDKGDGELRLDRSLRRNISADDLSQVQDSLTRVKRAVVEEKETDMCLLESHEERLKSIDTDLPSI